MFLLLSNRFCSKQLLTRGITIIMRLSMEHLTSLDLCASVQCVLSDPAWMSIFAYNGQGEDFSATPSVGERRRGPSREALSSF